MEFLLFPTLAPLSPSGRPPAWKAPMLHPSSPAAHSHTSPRFSALRGAPPGQDPLCPLQARRRALSPYAALGPARSLITNSVRFPVLIPTPPPPTCSRPVSLAPPLPGQIRPPAPLPRSRWVQGWEAGKGAGTAPAPWPPSDPEAEGAPGGGAEHRPAGPARAGPGPGAGLPLRPPAGRGQPGEPGIAVAQVRPGCTPPWDCAEHLMGPVGRRGKGPGRWVEGEMSGGEGQGSCLPFPAGAFPEGPGSRGRPGPAGEWGWVLAT